ncbi:hypothetical protein V8C35DRAFT_286631 [Trichoderma chlorosporum]
MELRPKAVTTERLWSTLVSQMAISQQFARVRPTICPLAQLVAQACGSAIGYRRAPDALWRAIHDLRQSQAIAKRTMIPVLHLADSKPLTCDYGLRGIGVLCSTRRCGCSTPIQGAGDTRFWPMDGQARCPSIMSPALNVGWHGCCNPKGAQGGSLALKC